MKRIKILVNIMVMFCLIVTIIGTIEYIFTCGKYAMLSFNIYTIELQGKKTIYVPGNGENGENYITTNGWTGDPLISKTYEKAKQSKEKFIEKSDIAKWISDCAMTKTGNFIRLMMFGLAIFICYRCSKAFRRLFSSDMELLMEKLRI